MAEEGSGGSGGEGGSSNLGNDLNDANLAEELLRRSAKYLEDEIELLKKKKDLVTNISEQIKLQDQIKSLEIDKDLRLAELKVEQLEKGTAAYIQAQKELETQRSTAAVQERTLKVTQATRGAFDEIFSTTLGMTSNLSLFGVLLEDTEGFVKGMGQSFKKIVSSGAIVSATFEKILESSIALAYETDQTFVNFQKTTGQIDQFGGEFNKVIDDLNQYGVTADSLVKSQTALMKGSVAFNKATVEQQVAIAGTVAELDHMGVSSDTSAKNFQMMTDVLGMGAAEAENNVVMLKNLADELPGISADDLATSFSGAGDTIAKFGVQGVDVFRDLARAAEASGMAIKSLIAITEKFDTFSGAADQVGKLNAILGGPFLNSMKMMQVTDPAERMRMLSDAVNDAGLSFDEMGYYQRIALKEALGLESMADLAKVMAGEFGEAGNEVNKTAAELMKSAEETKKYTTAQQELEQTMKEFAVTVQPAVEVFKTLLQLFQTINQATGGWLIPTLMLLGTVIYSVLTIQKISNAVTATANLLSEIGIVNKIKEIFLSRQNTASKISEAGAQDTLNKAQDRGSSSTEKMGKAAGGAWKNLLALGGAIALIGIGIGAAAFGLSLLVASFKDLGDMAPYALIGIAMLTVGILGMMVVLGALVAGPQAAIAAGAVGLLLSIAAAAVGIGLGVGLAAYGMSLLVASFKDLGDAAGPAVAAIGAIMLGFVAMIGILAVAAAMGPAVAIGLAAIFMSIGVGLAMINREKFKSLAQVFEGLGEIANGNLANLNAALYLIREIKDTINAIDDTEKVVKLQKVIDSINTTARGQATASAVLTPYAYGSGTAAGAAVQNVYVQIDPNKFQTYIGKMIDGRFKAVDRGSGGG